MKGQLQSLKAQPNTNNANQFSPSPTQRLLAAAPAGTRARAEFRSMTRGLPSYCRYREYHDDDDGAVAAEERAGLGLRVEARGAWRVQMPTR
jgi:hypothetical protein